MIHVKLSVEPRSLAACHDVNPQFARKHDRISAWMTSCAASCNTPAMPRRGSWQVDHMSSSTAGSHLSILIVIYIYIYSGRSIGNFHLKHRDIHRPCLSRMIFNVWLELTPQTDGRHISTCPARSSKGPRPDPQQVGPRAHPIYHPQNVQVVNPMDLSC